MIECLIDRDGPSNLSTSLLEDNRSLTNDAAVTDLRS